MAEKDVILVSVVGHTNAGKTSLLRTLTRNVHFGEVSDRPGTTRHAESVDLLVQGQPVVRFYDTPGLEDSVALLDFLHTQPGATRPDKVRAFLQGPEARGVYEQEAKVLRNLLEVADAALYVIDSREAVLPKHRAEFEILTSCAKPVMPVLNFVAAPSSRRAEWQQALLDANLHAQVEFDAVAPFVGAEHNLYSDLGTLLGQRRSHFQRITQALAQERIDRRLAACRTLADALVDLAAMRREISEHDYAQEVTRSAFVRDFQADVVKRTRKAVQDVLEGYGFRADDAELQELPMLQGRWETDLFNPEVLVEAGKRMGLGAMVGAGIGLVADIALAGLSLGSGTTVGATLGGAVSGGWRPLWRKIENAFNGVQELTLEDPVLLLLTERMLQLIAMLEQRGHAAQNKLQLPATQGNYEAYRAVLAAVAPARGHPKWEQTGLRWGSDADRSATVAETARTLSHILGHTAT